MSDWTDPFAEPQEQDPYDAALICLNGHLVNENYHSVPSDNQKFCDRCGAATIFACPSCFTKIRGQYRNPEDGYAAEHHVHVPSACRGCGRLLPWRAAQLEAAKQLAEELDELSDQDKAVLSASFDDLVVTTPRTELAAIRVKKLLTKFGAESGEMLKRVLVDLATGEARRRLGL